MAYLVVAEQTYQGVVANYHIAKIDPATGRASSIAESRSRDDAILIVAALNV